MRKLLPYVLALVLIISSSACKNVQLSYNDNRHQNTDLSHPITNLEFWIAESVTITKEWIRIRVDVENKDGIVF
ncbi:MAG: hypothetical protein IJE90_00310 [Clostridia bacterium]|nr:hypothetical protein [Clostridia bacterium]